MDSNYTIPVHVGIIQDGNGRWAVKQGLNRSKGHEEGLKATKRIVKACSDLGIRYVTLYTFSSENWKRAESEVRFLLNLVGKYLKSELPFYRENQLRIKHIGALEQIPRKLQEDFQDIEALTKDHTGTTLLIAMNYGGRDEIIRAVNRILEAEIHSPIEESQFSDYLDTAGIPDPDLIIRSAGEHRLSNFLPWQSVYAEYYSSSTLWPDWTKADLEAALQAYTDRNRKFGGVNE